MSDSKDKKPEEGKPARHQGTADRQEGGRAEEENQFVTFVIGEETYGWRCSRSRNHRHDADHARAEPMSFMKGVINLRGSVVPVVDMRIKFTMSEREYDAFTVIIIVEVRGRMIGMIVDSVSDVVSIPVKSIQDTPHFSAKIETDFIMGIGQIEEKLVIILDVDRIMSSEEMTELERERTA